MNRLKLAATAAALLGGVTLASAAQATIFLDLVGNGNLATINSSGGTYTGYTVTDGGLTTSGEESLIGLGQISTGVYGMTDDQLFKLTLSGTTVTETAVGSVDTGVTFVAFGSTTSSMYALGYTSVAGVDVYHLYSINSVTGAIHQDTGVLGIGLALLPAAKGNSIGMSTDSSSLYLDLGANVYTLNTTTGVASLDGAITAAAGSTYAGDEFGALVEEGGVIYGGANDENHGNHTALYSFAVSGTAPVQNWAANWIVDSTNNKDHGIQFWGLAPGFSVKMLPEPSEWALMLVGVGAVGGALRARRRRAIAEA